MEKTISVPILFCIVAGYQYMENYGAHDWDGKGECPQYWKYKGGQEVVLATNLTLEVAEAALNDPHYRHLAAIEEYSSEFAVNQFLYLTIECANGPTQEEIWDAYDRGIDLEKEYYQYLTDDDFCNEPLDRYEAMAEACGYV